MLHPNRIELSKKAELDLEDILLYTLQKWGERQMLDYKQTISKTLRTILDNPNIGHRRQELPKDYKVFPVGQHLIIYKFKKDTIYISRILHQSRDLTRHKQE